MRTILGWHFLSDDRRLRFGNRESVEIGKTYRAVGALEMCRNGMHASQRILDALEYAPGSICCRVVVGGQILVASDKMVAETRTVLGMVDATQILHEFACLCAEDVLKRIVSPVDPRSLAAIKAKRDWLEGKISSDELCAARAAAWDAASDAAKDTACDAACDAVRDAAWDAAKAAAWAAARAAAWDAVRDAACDAVRDAAWDAAMAAARAAQNDWLTREVSDHIL
jgi:hypothetical protein